MFRLIIVLIGLLVCTSFIQASVTYTPTTDTNCNGNVCNKILYSGIKNVYEDKTWKRVEDARSLKGSGVE